MASPIELRELTAEERSVVEANINLAYYIANRFTRTRLSRKDRGQIALLGLIRAAQTYDSSRKVRFNTYATAVIRTHLIDANRDDGIIRIPRYVQTNRAKPRGMRCLAAAGSARHVATFGAIESDFPVDPPDREHADPDEYDERERRIAALLSSIDRLPDRERRVVMMRMARRSYDVIRLELGCSMGAVRELERAAHRQIRADLARAV